MRARFPAGVAAALVWVVIGCQGDGDPGLIIASGHVEATEVRVSAKVGGTLESLPIDEGDAVVVGQEIARLDTTDTLLTLAAAKAERSQAEAQLRLRVAGAREEDIAAAQAQVARGEADLEGARKDLERMEGLLASGSGPRGSTSGS